MFRITFVAGYAILMIMLICTVATSVLAMGTNEAIGDSPLTRYAMEFDKILFSPNGKVWLLAVLGGYLAAWIAACIYTAKRSDEWERQWTKTLIVGCALMLVFVLIPASIGLVAHFGSGFVQEVAQRLAGTMASPVLMESSLVFIALFVLFCYNGYRRERDGDEYVEVEFKDES